MDEKMAQHQRLKKRLERQYARKLRAAAQRAGALTPNGAIRKDADIEPSKRMLRTLERVNKIERRIAGPASKIKSPMTKDTEFSMRASERQCDLDVVYEQLATLRNRLEKKRKEFWAACAAADAELDKLNPEASMGMQPFVAQSCEEYDLGDNFHKRISRILDRYHAIEREGDSARIGNVIGIVGEITALKDSIDEAYDTESDRRTVAECERILKRPIPTRLRAMSSDDRYQALVDEAEVASLLATLARHKLLTLARKYLSNLTLKAQRNLCERELIERLAEEHAEHILDDMWCHEHGMDLVPRWAN